MRRVVLDSDIVINHIKDNDDDLEILVVLQKSGRLQLYLPTIVLVEVLVGYELTKSKIVKINKLLSKFKSEELTKDLADLSAKLGRENKLAFLGTADLTIAATTLSLKAELATHNVKHFKQIPKLKLFDFKKLKEV